MNGLDGLKICVEKSLSKDDIETFAKPLKAAQDIKKPDPDTQYLKRYDITEKDVLSDYHLIRRFTTLINNGVVKVDKPRLSVPDIIYQKAYHIKKLPVSFNLASQAAWTPLSKLEGLRRADGSLIEIDPIEYEIRGMSAQEAVKTVVKKRIEPLVDLTFDFQENDDENYGASEGVIRIGFDPDQGSWALIGLDHIFSRDKITVNFGWLDAATIMHEFGHILGLVHEHQNPHGKTIEWNEDAVYTWAKKVHGWDEKTAYNNMIKKYEKNTINGIKFDPKSIMLYFFPGTLTKDGKGTEQNMRLALYDMKFLMMILPGKSINYKQFYKKIYGDDEINKKAFMAKVESDPSFKDMLFKYKYHIIAVTAMVVASITIITLFWYKQMKLDWHRQMKVALSEQIKLKKPNNPIGRNWNV